MKNDDTRWKEWFDFRVIDSDGKLYLQREYMVPGNDADGTYNPCIRTEWYTLSILNDYQFSYEFKCYRVFERVQDVLTFCGRASEDKILSSAVHRKQSEAGKLENIKVLYTKEELVRKFPEYAL